jgi:cold shock CspA family protein
MAITNKATITQWDDGKGFGFATANGVKYFLHISALGRPARAPRVGDTVVVLSFGKTDRGPRIEKGELEGVPMQASPSYSRQIHATGPRKNKPFRKFMLCVCIALAAISGIYSLAGKVGLLPGSAPGHDAPHYSTSGQYTTRDEVAKYICDYGHLPPNYVNKSEGKRLYESRTGNTFRKWNFNPLTTLGVMIGGDGFSNREGLLPPGDYREADVDYFGENRGTKRLVYSSGCNIYYTGDHYGTFTKLSF